MVEQSAVIARCYHGRLPMSAYVAFLQSCLYAYEVLEAQLHDYRDHPALGGVSHPGLFRAARIRHDLATLEEIGAEPYPDLLQAGPAYAAHLAELGAELPAALLGHTYLRYGRLLRHAATYQVCVQQAFCFPDGFGGAYYDFTDYAPPPAQATHFDEALNRAILTPTEYSAVLEEAVLSFHYSLNILDEVEQLVLRNEG